MADILIKAGMKTDAHFTGDRRGIFWTSTTVGYLFFIEFTKNLHCLKTINGGATWVNEIDVVESGGVIVFDCWADWETAGDAGTKINIAYMDTNSNDVRYVYLDTDDDSVAGDDQIEACQGSGVLNPSASRLYAFISITKARGGNLCVAYRYADSLTAYFYNFRTSPDATTWTVKDDVWEAHQNDYVQLYPANLADNQDIWGAFWDDSADEISLKTYDNSGDSWAAIAEVSISGGMERNFQYLQMSGVIRLIDGCLLLAAWSDYDDANADLMTWVIDGAGSITAKTNVISNEAETFGVSCFVNQDNGHWYVAYMSGTSAQSLEKAFYQKSQNGGTNWLGENPLQANPESDIRAVYAGVVKAIWGGFFQPAWFEDDDNDLWTNIDNDVAIPASGNGGEGIADKSANMGSKMVAAGLI